MNNKFYKVRVRSKTEFKFCKVNEQYKDISIGDRIMFKENDELLFGETISPITILNKDESIPFIVDSSSRHSAEELANVEKLEKDILNLCKEKSESYKLDMNFVKAEYSLDTTKVIVFFCANKRIDFRDLVKDVNAFLKNKSRLELWQISSREKSALIGGIGICGREICCRKLGKIPDTVAIKSVKDQGLEINPLKITGLCCKLMCCLTYEHSQYLEIANNFPKLGSTVKYSEKEGIVRSANYIKGTVTVEFEDALTRELKIEEIVFEK